MSNQNEYPLPKDSYVAFDAISLRNHILRRLDEQGTFTDHNYLGSNLASIIDIVSFTYNTLIYYLHKTSNESMFTEAQLYENINRIVKALDYKPIGYQTSTLAFSISADQLPTGFYAIPRYAYILIGEVPFSFNEDLSFVIKEDGVLNELTDISNKKLMYEGLFKESEIFISAGDPSEVFTVNTSNNLVDHNNVHVYVYEQDVDKWVQYKEVPTLYSENPNAKVFEKRLNSSKQYEITFGDNINGRKLNQGDKVVCYYLESSGTSGVVGPGALSNKIPATIIFSTPTYDAIQTDTNTENLQYITLEQFAFFQINNAAGSTLPIPVESAEEIRKKAPGAYRSQYRLVTKKDYENYIQTNFSGFLKDVKVFDNWDYNTQYIKYFNDIQVKPTAFRQVLFNQIQYADSCNFNNVYVCALPRTSQGASFKYLLPAQKEIVLSNLQPVKTLTTEISFIDPIYKAIGFGVNTTGTLGVGQVDLATLELIKTPRSNKNSSTLIQQVIQVFEKYFSVNSAKLGVVFPYSAVVSELLSIDGISGLRTKRGDTQETFDGLSFIMWNPNYPELDFIQISNNKEMNPFDVIYFNDIANIKNKITVVDK
jgi:hypothetical protein